MTLRQVRWAADHDWFRGALELSPGSWAVIADDSEYYRDGRVVEKTETFTDFRKLRCHAGY